MSALPFSLLSTFFFLFDFCVFVCVAAGLHTPAKDVQREVNKGSLALKESTYH